MAGIVGIENWVFQNLEQTLESTSVNITADNDGNNNDDQKYIRS